MRKNYYILLLMILFSYSQTYGASKHFRMENEITKIEYLTIQMRNVSIVVEINDIVVMRSTTKENSTSSSSQPIREFLIDGKNSVRILVQPKDSTSAYANIRLAIFDVGDFLTETSGKTLGEYKFKISTESEPLKEKYQYSTNFEYSSNKKWKWESAEKLTLNKELISEANDFMALIQRHIKEENTDVMAKLFSQVIEDKSYCYPGFPPEARAADLKDYMSNFQVLDLNKIEIGYRLSADGRLLECIDKENHPIIRTEPDAEPTKSLEMFIGKINNEFVILR